MIEDRVKTCKADEDRSERLRERLSELRDDALEETISVEVKAAARAVVSDDGREIRPTLYAQHGAVATVALDQCRAIALAGKLIEAALSRLKGRMTP